MYVYGKNVVREFLDKDDKVIKAFVSKKFSDKDIINKLKSKNVKINYSTNFELDKKTDNALHQGIVLLVDDIKTYTYDEIIPNINKEYKTVVMLDHLQDPHNFGAIIRTSYALGVDAIIIPNDRSINISSVVVKTSAGAIKNIPIIRVPSLISTVNKLKKDDFWIVGTSMNKDDYTKIDYKRSICLIIGNEGKGMSTSLLKECDYVASINMVGKIDSLNASVSCGIILAKILEARSYE